MMSQVTLLVAVATLAAAPVFAESNAGSKASSVSASVAVEFNVRVPMRDGVALSANVYRPAKAGRYPVVVVRTPYTKTPNYDARGRFWAREGYVFIVQDVRGRGDSDGPFIPLVHEADDGVDTFNWAARQAWSSGKIGTLGGSYGAWTQLYPASSGESALTAMIPMAVPPDPDRSFPLHLGVPVPATVPWLASIDGHTLQSLAGVDLQAAYDGRPLIDMDQRMGRNLPAWREWLQHPVRDTYWEVRSYQTRLLDSVVPALYISGWYDDVLVGALENFTNMTTRGRAEARDRQRLVIGPWGHAINAARKLGQIDFGPSAVIDMDDLHRRWFDRWLKGLSNGVDEESRVRLFVMGSNEWVNENEWPIARTQYTKYYLRSDGAANSLSGNGTLSTTAPGRRARPDKFRFDPDEPVPFATALDSKQMGGPDDYRQIEERADVLVYSTAPSTTPLRICGPLRVELFASSSAIDTDWTAKLLDVHPDGYAQRLNDGIVRGRFRHGHDKEVLLTPGKVEQYSIDLWSTCVDILPGHRLRLEISSSAAGKFAVNLNTAGDQATQTKGVIAAQTVYHDATRLSHVLLPIVPPKSE